ncbi:MAG TPA: hypothetical protein DC049_14960 [Spirochaetia bacterium]|nr:hypothetical protein [Spirochaetia bacterium]
MKKFTHPAFFKICGIIILSAALLAGQEQQDEIRQVMKYFMENIKQKNKDEIFRMLDDTISVKSLSREVIKEKIDKLIMNEITAIDYLQNITGHNVSRFFFISDNTSWEIKDYSVSSDVYNDSTENNGKIISYYFIKFTVSIIEKTHGAGGAVISSRIIQKAGEVDIINKNAHHDDVRQKYRIFGLIL